MATYQSVGTSTVIVNADTVTVTKPSGVEVGDLMIAGLFGAANDLSNITAPAGGWVEIDQVQVGSGSTATRGELFYKIATSDDVSASDYTFTTTDGTTGGNYGGIIVRLSDAGIIAGNAIGGESISGGTGDGDGTISGFNPSRADCLFVAFSALSTQVTSGPYNMTGLSLATDNPTWTERAEIQLDVTNDTHAFACYTATRSQVTATGTITYTFTSQSENARAFCMVVAVSPVVSNSITPTTKINAYSFSPTPKTAIDAIVEDPETKNRKTTPWQSETKPTTNWIKEI